MIIHCVEPNISEKIELPAIRETDCAGRRFLSLQAPAKDRLWIRRAQSIVARAASRAREGGWRASTAMGHEYSGAVYVGAAIFFNSENGDSSQGNPALFLRGGWGRKKPESMGYGSLSSRKIWHLPEKNKAR